MDDEISVSKACVDCDNRGSWVFRRFCTVRKSRNASFASFSGSTSLFDEGGRVCVRFGDRRLKKIN